MAKEYTTKDGKKIVGWYRRGGKAIPIIEGQVRKGEGKQRAYYQKDKEGQSYADYNNSDAMKKDIAVQKKKGRDLISTEKVGVRSAKVKSGKKAGAPRTTPKETDKERAERQHAEYMAKEARREANKPSHLREETPKEKKKVRLPVGDYSGEPSRWSSTKRYIEGDRIISGKDGLIHVFNDGKKETLPKGYEIEDMHKDYDYSTFDTRVRKDGVYYYPKMPSRKKADAQARKESEGEKAKRDTEKFVKDYYDTMMKAGQTADKVRQWGNDASWREAISKTDDERKKWQKASNGTEDVARFIEGREPVARIASKLIKTANEHADEVTRDLQESLQGDAGSVDRGLPFRVKGQDSMHRKLREKSVSKGLQPEQYADKVTDALRFTDMVDGDNYVESFNKLKKGLEDRGYEMVEVENTIHKEGAKYRGLNTLVESPKGYTFELQFHTPQSFDIKEENHKDYDVERRLTTSAEEKERLSKQMSERASKIETPKGAESIQNVPRHKRKGPSDSAIRSVMKERGMSRTEAVLYLRKKNKYE